MVITVLTLVVVGNQLKPSVIYLGVSPIDAAIVLVWLAGIYMIGKARTDLPWHKMGVLPDSQKEKRGHSMIKKHDLSKQKGISVQKVILVFSLCSLITLIAGVGLEVSGDAIAKQIGMTGVLFGATILAASTALPEVSTGLASMKLKDYQMAMSDIFGGNAFLPVLFMVANIFYG